MKKKQFLKSLSLILVFTFFLTNFNFQLNCRSIIVGTIKADATNHNYYYNQYTANTVYIDAPNWTWVQGPSYENLVGCTAIYMDPSSGRYINAGEVLRSGSIYNGEILYMVQPYGYMYKYYISKDGVLSNACITIYSAPSTTPLSTKIKGTLITSDIMASNGTYPDNGYNSADGYWYEKTGIFNSSPVVTISSPTQSKNYGVADTNIVPAISVSDADNDNLTCKFFVDTGVTPFDIKTVTNTVSAQIVSFASLDMTSLSDGSHSIRYEINDGYATTTSTVNFIVDKTPPTIGAVNITSNINSISVAGSATDSTSGLSWNSYRYTIGTNVSVWSINTSYTQSSLIPNTMYAVKFEAIDNEGNIANSVQNTYTLAQPPTFTTNNITSTSMDLNFTDSNPAATQYQIQCGSNYVNASGSLTSTPTWVSIPSSKVITVNGLTPGTAYSFQAKARNGAGIETALSTAASWTTSVSSPTTPTNITSTTSQSAIILNWSPVSGATSYDVEKDGAVVSNGNSTTFTHSGLNQNTSHTYRVRASNTGGSSAWSNLLNISTLSSAPGVPTNVTAVTSSSAITVSWDGVYGAIGYDVEADGSVVDNGTKTTYIHSGLAASSAHTYRVRARTSGGSGSWSALMNVTTLAAAPAVPTNIVSSTTGTAISLSWNAVSGATGYDVEADGAVTDNGTKTTFTHTGLTLGTQHTYKVRSKNAGGTSSWSSPITQTVQSGLPSVPSNVVLSSTQSAITMSWNPVSGVTGYDVQADGTVINNGAATSYVHSGLTPSTSHTYMVRAKNSAGTGNWSSLSTASTLPNPPIVPANINATTTGSSITLSWSPSPGATSYDVSGDGSINSNVTGSAITFNGLAPQSQHSYMVRADNLGGTSNWSTPVSITTAQVVPGIPTNITTTQSSISISLSWNPVYGADSYIVEADGVSVNNGNITTYTNSGLTVNTTHTYRVKAKNSAGESSFSAPISVKTLPTPPGVPTNVKNSLSNTSINLTWDRTPSATGYDVEFDGNVIDNGNNIAFSSTGLAPSTSHTFRVRAKNSDGTGNWSNLGTVTTTLLDIPSNINATVTSSSAIQINWNPVTNATGYDIEVDGVSKDNGASTVYTHTGLSQNSQHTYRVRAKNVNGTSAWSGLITKSTSTLGIPSNIIAMTNTSKVTLIWQPITGATGYDVETDGVVSDNGLLTTYTKSGLNNNSPHTFRVRTKSSGLIGDWSTLQTVTTLPSAPDIPTNITTTLSNTSVTLTWNTVANSTGYDVEVDGVVIDNGLSNTYVSTGLAPNSQHTYRVRAKNVAGAGVWSSYNTAKTNLSLYTLNCNANDVFNMAFTASNITDFSKCSFTLTYNPNDLDIVDLNSATAQIDLTVGAISGTNVTVTQFTPGKVTFTVSGTISSGQVWSGIVDSIKFKSKISGQSLINYNIKQ